MEETNGKNKALDNIPSFLLNNITNKNLEIITHHILSRNLDKVREFLENEESPSINYYAYNENRGLSDPNMPAHVGIELLENVEIDWSNIANAEAIQEDMKAGAINGITKGVLNKVRKTIDNKNMLMGEFMKRTIEGTLYYTALSKLSGEMVMLSMKNSKVLFTEEATFNNIDKKDYKEIYDITNGKLFILNGEASGELTDKDTGEHKVFSLRLRMYYSPLFINLDTGESYFPVNAYIYNTGLPYTKWIPEEKQAVWEKLKEELKERNNPLEIMGDETFNKWIIENKPKITKRKITTDNFTFPITCIDRNTKDMSSIIFSNKGLFTNYNNLKNQEEIINEYKEKYKLQELTPEQVRQALTEAGEYKTNKFVIKDFGSYAIGFNSFMYMDYLIKVKEELETREEKPFLFDDDKKTAEIQKALRQMKLYILGHKIFMIILAEAEQQKRSYDIVILKEKLLQYLGYKPEEKHIYNDIKEALFSLRYLDYVFYDYSKITKAGRAPGNMIGNFIYNLRIEEKRYVLAINQYFLGCIETMFNAERIENKEERKELFKRGYYKYPTAALPMSRDYSEQAYFLLNFLLAEKGNDKLNNKQHKVISHKCKRFAKEAHIDNKRIDKRMRTLLKIFKEIDIIEDTEPKITELESLRPALINNKILRVFIKTPVEKLNEDIHRLLRNKKEPAI